MTFQKHCDLHAVLLGVEKPTHRTQKGDFEFFWGCRVKRTNWPLFRGVESFVHRSEFFVGFSYMNLSKVD